MGSIYKNIWIFIIGSSAFLLASCQQSRSSNNRSVFQTKAQAQLDQITRMISSTKGFTSPSLRGATGDANSWIPFNNAYFQQSPTVNLQDVESYLATVPVTVGTFAMRITSIFRAALATYYSMNPLATNMYRNVTPLGQQSLGYGVTWRYPGQFSNFQSIASQIPGLQSFMQQGYVQNPVMY